MSATAVTLVVGTVVALSLRYEGVATADVSLDDGGVWVSSTGDTRLGRLNHPIREVDAQLAAATASFDILQEADDVLIIDEGLDRVEQVDTAAVATTTGASLPADSLTALGGGTFAVLDSGTGDVKVVPVAQLAALEDEEAEPTLRVGPRSVIDVDVEGTTWVFDPTSATLTAVTAAQAADLATLARGELDAAEASQSAEESEAEEAGETGDGAESTESASSDEASEIEPVELATWDLAASILEPEELDDAALSLTTVGTSAVVMVTREIRVDRENVPQIQVVPATGEAVLVVDVAAEAGLDVDASEVKLQASGPASSSVVVAARNGLIRIPLGGGEPAWAPSDMAGSPAEPVVVDGCAFGAWGGTEPMSMRFCNDVGVTWPVPELSAEANLVFRVNRDKVVLNDMRAGGVWMIENQLIPVEDWISTSPPPNAAQEEQDSHEDVQEDVPLDRQEENRPPNANPDDLGLRAGTTRLLPLLDNDSDPDGDLLTISSFSELPAEFGVPQVVMGGRALQVAVPGDAAGSTTFSYTADDGRGGTAQADATLKVVGPDSNRPPELLRDVKLSVMSGASVSANVFSDIRDPDGDELTLVSAVTDSAGDTVRTTPDGGVTFSDAGVSTGAKIVTLQVFDGFEIAELPITIEVVTGNEAPRAEFDFATAFVGETIVLTPLDNDTDSSGIAPRLAQASQFGNGETAPNYLDGTIEFTPSTPGATYATYLIADEEGMTAEGLIRVDVATAADGDPIAVRDTALLPPGGEVLVDVLHNDSDPQGGVLVVQQVDVPSGYGLRVAVLEHKLLRITSDRVLSEPVQIGYTIANATGTAQGEVSVIPLRADTQPQPPVAVKDVVSVRAGDYVTVPVLTNDHHPNGLAFELDEALVTPPQAGLLFATQDVLRFQAPTEPGQQVAIYSVTDSFGQQASAQVVFNVRAPEGNAAPVPVDVATRAFQREQVRIPISLVGIDPDGDSVQLLGLASAPSLGQVVEIGTDYLDYVPFGNAVGTDTFTFVVRDRIGQTATGTVQVGIVPPPDINRNPVVPPVEAHHRPERTVRVDVLLEATDPDGDQLAISAVTDPGGLAVTFAGGELEIQTPPESGIFAITFEVIDGNGGQATSTLSLQVSPQAPLFTPIAVDDLVPVAEIVGFDFVDVDVLANDSDPDGVVADLELTVPQGQPNASMVLVDGQPRVQVTLEPLRQVVTYQITDKDERTTFAFIDVPGTSDSGPALRSGFETLTVLTGQQLLIELNEQIVAVSGDPVQVTDPNTVLATNSDGTAPVVDSDTLTFTSTAGYVGPASVTVEVTDAADLNDPERKVSMITIPIEVLPDGNSPPTIMSTEVEVEAGVSEPQVIKLPPLADDRDAADLPGLSFALLGQPDGFSVELVNSTELHVTAALDTAKGSRGEFQVSVSDGVNEPVVGTLVAIAVASRAPLAFAVDDDLGEIQQGQAATIDVLTNDTDPFGLGLSVLSATVETGAAGTSISGSNVTVTPPGDFVGRLSIVYTLRDATGDPDRAVQARVRASVIGVPAAPGAPRVESVGNREVTLSYTTPIDNGAPITGYTVEWAGGAQECASATCRITGLTNDVEYTFTVTASNKVGRGPASSASAPARPDVRPEAPAAPTLAFKSEAIDVRWTPPANEGSAITGYDVQISPAVGGGQQSVGTQTTLTWGSLTNGTAYTFRVRAKNDAPEPGEWSPWSLQEVPAAPPATPQTPRATRVDTPIGGQIQVSWQAPAANGDALREYVLTPSRGGVAQPAITLPPGTLAYTYAAENGSDYTFAVSTSNKAGPSATSPSSSSVRSFGKPGAVAAVTATVPGQNGTAVLDFASPSDNGQAIDRFQYSANGATWVTLGANRTVQGLTNGTSYSFQVRACNTYCADAGPASGPVTPYGPIGVPTVTGSKVGATGARFTFGRPPGGANGRPEAAFQYSIDGTGWLNVPAGGSVDLSGSYQQTFQAQVRYAVSGPAQETTASARVTTDDPPPPVQPSLRIIRDRPVNNSDCNHSSCHFVDLGFSDLPGGTYTVTVLESTNGGSSWEPLNAGSNGGVRDLSGGRYNSLMFYGNPTYHVRIDIVGQQGQGSFSTGPFRWGN